ncbi:MAG TPA: hypothetical protein VK285_01385 [Gaiellaceae bacterium]|nr:hypothetical protein [Gaiellaceae bacterium]
MQAPMEIAAPGSTGDARGAPRLLEHCAVVERLVRAEGRTARARLEEELGGHLAGLLCRALVQRQPSWALVFAL